MTALIRDRDAERWVRLLVAMGEETDDDGRVLRPEFAVELISLCWSRPKRRVMGLV